VGHKIEGQQSSIVPTIEQTVETERGIDNKSVMTPIEVTVEAEKGITDISEVEGGTDNKSATLI